MQPGITNVKKQSAPTGTATSYQSDTKNKHSSSSYSHLAKKGSVVFLSRIIQVLIGIGKITVITRILGPANRGLFGLFARIPESVVGVGNYGFGDAIMYYLAKEKYELKKAVGATFLYVLFNSLFLCSLTYIILHFKWFFKDEMAGVSQYTFSILVTIPLYLLEDTGLKMLVAVSKTGSASSIRGIKTLLLLLSFTLIWLLSKDGFAAAIYSWVFSAAICALLPYFLLRKQGIFPMQFDLTLVKQALKYGFSGYLSQCFEIILLRLGFFYIAAIFDPVQLGFYAVATRIAEMMRIIPQALVAPFIPILFGMEEKDSTLFTPRIVKTVFWSMTLISILVGLSSKWFIPILLGNEFAPSHTIFIYLLPGIIGYSVFSFLRFDLFGRNKPSKVSQATGITLIITAVAIYFLIKYQGVNGAAMASSLSFITAAIMTMFFYHKESKVPIAHLFFFTKPELKKIKSLINGSLKNKHL